LSLNFRKDKKQKPKKRTIIIKHPRKTNKTTRLSRTITAYTKVVPFLAMKRIRMQFGTTYTETKTKEKQTTKKGERKEKREEENVPYVMKPFFPTKFPWMFNFIV
jgi:hypothetical protein